MRDQKKIGVDIDEVVVEFFRKYLELFNKKFNHNLKFEDITSFHIWDVVNIPKEASLELIREFYDSEDFYTLPLVDGAKDALGELSQKYKIYFITSRPEQVREKTFNFLKKHLEKLIFSLHFSGGVWGEHKSKGEICEELGIDVFIEDNFDYALDCAKRGIKTFLMDKPWNQKEAGYRNLIRVKNWSEIVRRLE